jgi:hypothetical protein
LIIFFFVLYLVDVSNDLLEYITPMSSANKNSAEASEDVQEPRPKRHKSSSSPKMSSGFDVGLHSADKVRRNLERNKRDEKDLANNPLSGRDAAIIYRDNTGMYA